jgi:hypothetical protein
MLRQALISTFALAAVAAGCASRTGVAYIEIENDQTGVADKAEPVYIDPRVEAIGNEYRRSWVNDGSNIRQSIRVRGPIMIVPANLPPAQPGEAR